MPTQSTLPKRPAAERPASTVGHILAMPPHWLASYEEFITRNASQVSQIESALRSLTYIIPGRFRDAEIASESIHSGVQLLTLYHDSLLAKAVARLPIPPPVRTAHARYTRFWADKSKLYRRVAMMLQMVTYTELLCEMSAKRRGGEKLRWRVVVLLEGIKAVCRLLLLRITRSRQIVSPVLPEREPIPDELENEDDTNDLALLGSESEFALEDGSNIVNGHANGMSSKEAQEMMTTPAHARDWSMPRTGMSMPSLPESGDISSYLLSRVLTADDIRPAAKLLNQLRGVGQAAEVLHILAPLAYAVALMRCKNKRSWTPWLIGLAVEYAARQLRDSGSLRTTPLERDEWNKRGWSMMWWSMRGAFYENVTKGVVKGVSRRMPSFVGGIMEDYEYLWENYYFSTSA